MCVDVYDASVLAWAWLLDGCMHPNPLTSPHPPTTSAPHTHTGFVFSRYFIFHKPNKTWQQIFWLTISVAINNAYILYKMSDAYHAKRYSRAQFGERLVKELLDLEACSPGQ